MTMRQCKIAHLNDLSEIRCGNMQDARQEVHLDGVHLCCKKGVHFKDRCEHFILGVHLSWWQLVQFCSNFSGA